MKICYKILIDNFPGLIFFFEQNGVLVQHLKCALSLS